MGDDQHIYRIVINAILGPIVSVLGIIGNILCLMAIWYRNYNIKAKNNNANSNSGGTGGGIGSRMYTFIVWLAIADLGYLAFNLQENLTK